MSLIAIMKITKIVETSIDIKNPVRLFSNAEPKIIELLAQQFEGRCYKGCLINRILSIKKRSFCEVNRFSDPNIATINVVFEVTATVYAVGEIINGCRIINRNEETGVVTLAKGDNVKIIMGDPRRNFESFKRGSLVSVIVGTARYPVNHNAITINSTMLRFPAIKPAFTVAPTSWDNVDAGVKQMYNDAVARLDHISSTADGAALVKFYDNMLSAFKLPAGRLKDANQLPLIEAIAKGGNISVDPRLPISSINVVVGEPNREYSVFMEAPNSEEAIFELVNDMANRINTICDHVEIYNTRKLIEEYKALWELYKIAKV